MRIPFIGRRKPLLNLNDPKWGQGSNDGKQDDKQDDRKDNKPDNKPSENGPPELDQLWRDFNQALARLLGKDSQRQGGGSPNESGTVFIGVGLIAGLLVLLWLSSGFFSVVQGQTAVVTTFGKYSYKTLPGFNWRWPYPIQAHEVVNMQQVRTVEVGYRGGIKNKQLKESLMLTDDENIIDIQFAVQYTLKDAVNWLYKNKDQEAMISQVAETSIREIVGRSKMDFVLKEGRASIGADVKVLMQQVLDRYDAGVQIANVTLQAVQPPEQVQEAFDDAVKAEQDKERLRNEGQAYANDVIPKAEGEVSRVLQDAEAYRSRVVANAEGNASRFKQVVNEYQKAPAVTRDRMYLETMQQIFSSTTKMMIDSKSSGNMIYLPIDKMLPQSEGGQAKPTTGTGESVPSIEVRGSRDSRNHDVRERESR